MASTPGTPDGDLAFGDYPRPAVAVDPVVLEVSDSRLQIVVWRRGDEPHKEAWALPGVFVQLGETLDGAVQRAVAEKCGIVDSGYVEQLFTSDVAGRDPRGWVVAVAYFVVVQPGTLHIAAAKSPDLLVGDVEVEWSGEGSGPATVAVDGRRVPLAFDHEQILGAAVGRLRGRVRYTPVAMEFLPPTFTLRELQKVYEAILGSALNKDSFRRHVVQTMKFVESTGESQTGVAHRPAELYRRS